MAASIYWLILGIVFIAIEGFGVPGIGFFFAGLGAFFVGIIIEAGVVPPAAWVAQLAWFFAFSCISAVLLWKPMQKWRLTRSNGSTYNNMVGERAVVARAPLVKHRDGNVTWSGTIMVAELVSGSPVESVAVGEVVYIKDVRGNKLMVDIN